MEGDHDEAAREAWNFNLSAKRFKDTFGAVVATDPGMQEDSWEWFRNVVRDGRVDRILCCPEDVVTKCNHPAHFVCADCEIPICNECFALEKQKEKYLGVWRTTTTRGMRMSALSRKRSLGWKPRLPVLSFPAS